VQIRGAYIKIIKQHLSVIKDETLQIQFALYRKLNSVSITKTKQFMTFIGNNSYFIVRIIRNKSILRAGMKQRARFFSRCFIHLGTLCSNWPNKQTSGVHRNFVCGGGFNKFS